MLWGVMTYVAILAALIASSVVFFLLRRSIRRPTLKLIGPPKTGFPNLYHYQAFRAEWLRQAIVDKRLYFSNPASFNDPWDCQPHFNSDAAFDPKSRERHVQYYIRGTRAHGANGTAVPEEEIQRRAQQFRNDPNYLRSKINDFSADFPRQIDRCWRVYCVGTRPDSELMWAHYAAKHNGICLEFTSRSPLFFQALRVRYLKYCPIFDMVEENDTTALMVLLTKSSAWKYEDEYRLIALERTCVASSTPAPRLITNNGLHELPDGSLKSVIVGCLADPSTVDAVRAIIREATYPIALKRVVKIPNEYKLLVTDVT